MAFDKPTLIIIGAGASLPYNYPLGDDLINEIITASDEVIHRGKITEAYSHLKDMLLLHDPTSIDTFMKNHATTGANSDYNIQSICKQLIAEIILKKENAEYFDKNKQVGGNLNWYRYLAHAILEDIDSLKDPNAALPFRIITFNYDVSLDYYLLTRILAAPLLSDEEKQIILKKLGNNIIHVYGAVRNVPWEDTTSHETIIRHLINKQLIKPSSNAMTINGSEQYLGREDIEILYGIANLKTQNSKSVFSPCKAQDSHDFKNFCNQAASNLRIIGEERASGKQSLAPYYEFMLNEMKKIMFLGFGFDKTNMELVFLSHRLSSLETIEYTNYGNKKKINDFVHSYFEVVDISCSTKDVYNALVNDFNL